MLFKLFVEHSQFIFGNIFFLKYDSENNFFFLSYIIAFEKKLK